MTQKDPAKPGQILGGEEVHGAGLGMSNALYFAAGPKEETKGLFGSLVAELIPEPQTWAMFAAGLLILGSIATRGGLKSKLRY